MKWHDKGNIYECNIHASACKQTHMQYAAGRKGKRKKSTLLSFGHTPCDSVVKGRREALKRGGEKNRGREDRH